MRQKYMKVTVTGLPQSGKTVLAELIGDVLADNGFDVLMETDEDSYSEGQQSAAVRALANSGIQVIVQERDAKQPRTQRPKPKKKHRDYFTGKDETIHCTSCDDDFVFTAGEQTFFKEKGLDRAPRRCRECRQKRRSRKNHADVAQW